MDRFVPGPGFVLPPGCRYCPSCRWPCRTLLIRDGKCFRCDPRRKGGLLKMYQYPSETGAGSCLILALVCGLAALLFAAVVLGWRLVR